MNLTNLLIVILLIDLSGLFSGLTLGLLSLNKTDLERKIKLGDKRAIKVYQVRKKGNLLLCTLLIGNVAVNSFLAVFLGDLTTGLIAVVVATSLIVIFGEITPQAIFSRHALNFGSKLIWLVKFFVFILYPVCWPISKVLDKTLGEEMSTVWSRKELAEIIKHHEDSKDSELDADEERILLGALSFSDKKVEEIMTPFSVVFMLEENTLLSSKILKKIRNSGFTRIPIYREQKEKIVGLLYAKKLIGLKKTLKLKKYANKRSFLEVQDKTKLDVLLNKLINNRIHLAFVKNEYNTFLGIVTLEDIIEEIFKKEIVDEDDKVVDLQKVARKKTEKKFSFDKIVKKKKSKKEDL